MLYAVSLLHGVMMMSSCTPTDMHVPGLQTQVEFIKRCIMLSLKIYYPKSVAAVALSLDLGSTILLYHRAHQAQLPHTDSHR